MMSVTKGCNFKSAQIGVTLVSIFKSTKAEDFQTRLGKDHLTQVILVLIREYDLVCS